MNENIKLECNCLFKINKWNFSELLIIFFLKFQTSVQ